MDFDFYDWVYYWDQTGLQSDNPAIGRWLGISHRVGSSLCYWILKRNGEVISRTTVQHIPELEKSADEMKTQLAKWDEALAEILAIKNFTVDIGGNTGFFLSDDVQEDEVAVDPDDPNVFQFETNHARGYDEETPDTFDAIVGSEVVLPDGNEQLRGRVVKRLRGPDGKPIGVRSTNPMLDTREYEVSFPDGATKAYGYNVIAENLFAQCDDEGNQYYFLEEISDHRTDGTEILKEDGFIQSRNGNQVPKITTRGWELSVEWKDGSSDWVPMKELKASHPVQLAEYAIANRIQDEPAFKWWVQDVLKKRNRIISKIKSRYWKTEFKFGVRLPKTVAEALRLDADNGNDLWRKSIEKEMSKVSIAFQPSDVGTPQEVRQSKRTTKHLLVGWQEVKYHWIFDVKLDGSFTRKSRLVANGSSTDPPKSNTYSTVVSRESVRIAFLLAALNDLDILAADVTNAYLNAPCREKIWCEAGPEFGANQGCVMKIVRALYGLKSSANAWRKMISDSLQDMGYESCRYVDPDVWLRPGVKPDGTEYYEMCLVYVDDILCLSHDTKKTMDAIGKLFELKKESVKRPDRYLGANICKHEFHDGSTAWAQHSGDYIANAIKTVEADLDKRGEELKTTKSSHRPFAKTYRPECDVSEELNDEGASKYVQYIGILRWAVELGRIDILTEVAQLSSHNCLPRVGHLEAVYSIFSYLKQELKHGRLGKLVFDDCLPEINENRFEQADWHDMYGDVEEARPIKAPKPRGKTVKVRCYVDADHAGNLITRRSHTGILIFLQNAPIQWYSKKQNTVESSTFGSEVVAMRTAVEMLEGIRYKLRMFGVPIDGPADVFCDNQAVVHISQRPEARLSKKHNAICFHRVREAVAAGWVRVAKEPTESNLADLFTKILEGPQRVRLAKEILY